MLRTRFLLSVVKRSTEEIKNSFVNFAVLQTYKKINGHLRIEPDYTVGSVPADANQWPAHFFGFKLGSYAKFILSGIREGVYSWSVIEALKSMGFDTTIALKESDSLTVNDSLLLAASTYIHLYGNGTVPSSFVVPNSPEWPEPTWGLSLGPILCKMRCYSDYQRTTRQSLQDIGISFDARTRRVDKHVYLGSIQRYKEIYGTANVPIEFVIPLDDSQYHVKARGIALGEWLHSLNKRQRTALKKPFDSLGVHFPNDTGKIPFTTLYSALCMFYSTHGHLNVPHKFTVPFQDPLYSEDAWGMALGRILYDIRRRPGDSWSRHREQLRALGVSLKTRNMSFQMLYDALVVFKMIHGHLDVVNTYVVPLDDDRYPEGVRGAKLGVYVRNMRNMPREQRHKDALKELGMNLTKRTNTRVGFSKVYACLVTFKEIHKHLNVPHGFRVPDSDNRYPEGSEGLTLGHTVTNIRLNNYYSEHRDKLEALGFAFVDAYIRNVVTALRVYKRLHGDLKIPYEYVVSSDDTAYPEETRGLGLGVIVSTFRQGRLRQEYASHLTSVVD